MSSWNIVADQYAPFTQKNDTLTNRGVDICYQRFDEGKSTLAAQLMRMSYRAVARRRAWEKERIGAGW
jgi:hypothetical protein